MGARRGVSVPVLLTRWVFEGLMGSLRVLTYENMRATILIMDKEVIARVVSEVERIARAWGSDR